MSTLGGIRTRSFRIESPASSPLSTTRARKGSGSRARTCVSRVTVARRTDSTIPERKRRQQDSNLRTTDRLRASNALPSQTRPCLQRKERESNPQGPKAHPFSRRGTAPVAVLPVTPAGIEPALPRVRAGSSPLSYGVPRRRLGGADLKDARALRVRPSTSVAGRDRTCGAPGFSRALYRAELRPRVEASLAMPYERPRGCAAGPFPWARLESNQRPLVCKTSALAGLSYSPSGMGRAGVEPAASSISEKRSSS